MTGVDERCKRRYTRIVEVLGGTVEEKNVNLATHVVVGCNTDGEAETCSLKYLRAVAAGLWIVQPTWLETSAVDGRFLDPTPFEVKGDANRKRRGLGLGGPARARRAVAAAQSLLLSDRRVLLLGAFGLGSHLTVAEVTDLVVHCGGEVLDSPSGLESDDLVLSYGAKEAAVDGNLSSIISNLNVKVTDMLWLLDSISQYKLHKEEDYVVERAPSSLRVRPRRVPARVAGKQQGPQQGLHEVIDLVSDESSDE
jgi:hypothetical protein